MPWSKKDFPNAMKNLPPLIRNKAIQIANALLLKTKLKVGGIIAIAISHAKKWAVNRGLSSRNKWGKSKSIKKSR